MAGFINPETKEAVYIPNYCEKEDVYDWVVENEFERYMREGMSFKDAVNKVIKEYY